MEEIYRDAKNSVMIEDGEVVLHVTHGKPAMTGEEVRRVMADYREVFK